MKPFDYLTVLISILMGLALANLMGGVVTVMHARHRLRIYWPSIVWAAVLFVVTVQHWWAEFSMHTKIDWTFGGFLATLMIPVDLYLLCSLVLPHRDNDGDEIDLRAWYFKNRRTFFVLLLLLAPLAYLEQLLTTGGAHKPPLESVMLGLMFLTLLAGIASRRPRIHALITGVFAVLVFSYVGLLFNRLPGQ